MQPQLLLLFIALVVRVSGQVQTGEHPDWPRWCGKVYKSGYPSFNPGGQTYQGPVSPNGPFLNVQFRPRYSLFLSDETKGEFVVKADLRPSAGQSVDTSYFPVKSSDINLSFSIVVSGTNNVLVSGALTKNDIGTGKAFPFSLTGLKPSLTPIAVDLSAKSVVDDHTVFTANTSLLYLPTKNTGTATRIDNLHGGLQVRGAMPGRVYQAFTPYGFFAYNDKFLNAPDADNQIAQYAARGLNAMVPLTFRTDQSKAFDTLNGYDSMKYMYDLRDKYQDDSWVTQQVLAVRDGAGLFAYWSADEPDGHQDPFDAPVRAHDLIRRLDPYHPVGVVLNCQNYYFAEYSAGADFIMEDAYPIGINATFSKWDTPCNTTLGDCGCDNCQGGVQDVARRLDDLKQYEDWLGFWPKTKIHVPQAFFGEGYWSRYPTVPETNAMFLLALNHGAQGILAWVWPTSDELATAYGKLARALAVEAVANITAGGPDAAAPRPLSVLAPADVVGLVDAAAWVSGKTMLVSIVNTNYRSIEAPVAVQVPMAKNVAATPWRSDVAWALNDGKLTVNSLPGLSTSMLFVTLS